MSQCPYCQIDQEDSRELLDEDLEHIVKDSTKLICILPKCGKIYYSWRPHYFNWGEMGNIIKEEEYQRLQNLYSELNPQLQDDELSIILPDTLKERYSDLLKSFDNKDSLAMKSYALRALLEAHYVDIKKKEVKNLSEDIKKYTKGNPAQLEALLAINKKLNNKIHIKETIFTKEELNTCCNFIYHTLKIEYQLKKAEEKLKTIQDEIKQDNFSNTHNIFQQIIDKKKESQTKSNNSFNFDDEIPF